MKSRYRSIAYTLCAVLFVLTVLISPTSLLAQEVRGKISGRVVDPNKASMPGALVKVTDVARGTTVTLTTNDEGLFLANYLLSGTYQVVVEATGFKKYIQDGVLLQIRENRDLEIVLEVGGTQETVTVTAELPTTEHDRWESRADGRSKRVEELPLVHGDPYTLDRTRRPAWPILVARLDRPFEPTHIVGYAVDGTRGNRSDLLIDGAPALRQQMPTRSSRRTFRRQISCRSSRCRRRHSTLSLEIPKAVSRASVSSQVRTTFTVRPITSSNPADVGKRLLR